MDLRFRKSQAQVRAGRDLAQPGGGVRLRPVRAGCFRRTPCHADDEIAVLAAISGG